MLKGTRIQLHDLDHTYTNQKYIAIHFVIGIQEEIYIEDKSVLNRKRVCFINVFSIEETRNVFGNRV